MLGSSSITGKFPHILRSVSRIIGTERVYKIVYNIPVRTHVQRVNNPLSKRNVDKAVQLVGSKSLLDTADNGLLKATRIEQRINTRIGWIQDKIDSFPKFSDFTEAQVYELDDCFQGVRFAASQQMWRTMMNIWYVWGKASNNSASQNLANIKINQYANELISITTQGAISLATKAKYNNGTTYPEHMIKFSLRARANE